MKDKYGRQETIDKIKRSFVLDDRFCYITEGKRMKEIKRSEIYYADLNPVEGSEQGGVRPVLILQNDIGNKFSSTTIVAAITSKVDRTNLPTHVSIRACGLKKNSIILLEQIRVIDKSRIADFIGMADEDTMENVKEAVGISLGI